MSKLCGPLVVVLVAVASILICIGFSNSELLPKGRKCRSLLCNSRAKVNGSTSNATNTSRSSDSGTKLIHGYCGEILTNIDGNSLVSFKSPHYPEPSSGDLNCEMKILLPHDYIVIRIDFIQFEADGRKFGTKEQECDADMFFLKGFNGWTPPAHCGNLTGFATFIDTQDPRAADMKLLTLLALMSSSEYKWNIQISFVRMNLESEKEPEEPSTKSGSGNTTFETETRSFEETREEFNRKPRNLEVKAIVHGKNTSILEVPWQVSLRQTYQSMEEKYGSERTQAFFNRSTCDYHENFHFCGGSIVHPKYILTAAHCFLGESKTHTSKTPSEVVVVVGDTAKCEADDDSKRYEVEQIIFHYAWDRAVLSDDIILLKLKTEIKIDGKLAKVIKLATEDNSYYEGRNATGSGWGQTDSNSSSTPNILQSNDHFVVKNRSECMHYLAAGLGSWRFLTHPKYSRMMSSVVCTGEAEWDHANDENGNNRSTAEIAHTAKGDSGGPLIVLEPAGPVQIGITSYGLKARGGTIEMDYFTSVPFYRHWIASVIGNN